MLFPTNAIACRCVNFFLQQSPELESKIRIIDLVPSAEKARAEELAIISPKISAVLFPAVSFRIAKAFWQHSGDGISSRRAEYCHSLFNKGLLVDRTSLKESPRFCKGPSRYSKPTSIDLTHNGDSNGNGVPDGQDSQQFVEERFGRNLKSDREL